MINPLSPTTWRSCYRVLGPVSRWHGSLLVIEAEILKVILGHEPVVHPALEERPCEVSTACVVAALALDAAEVVLDDRLAVTFVVQWEAPPFRSGDQVLGLAWSAQAHRWPVIYQSSTAVMTLSLRLWSITSFDELCVARDRGQVL